MIFFHHTKRVDFEGDLIAIKSQAKKTHHVVQDVEYTFEICDAYATSL